MSSKNRDRGNNSNATNFTGRQSGKGAGIPDPAELARARDEEVAAEAQAAEAAKAEAVEAASAEKAANEGALGSPVADLPKTQLVLEVGDTAPGEVVSVQRVAVQSEEAAATAAIDPPPLAQAVVKELQPPAVLEEPKVEEAPTSPPPFLTRVATHAAVVKVKRAESPEPTLTGFQPSTEFTAMMQTVRTNGTPTATRLVAFLDQYVVDMMPRRPRTPDQIRKAQEGLYLKLMEVVEQSPILEFERLFRILILYAREYRTQCFSPMYAMRGAPEWSRAPEQFHLFTRLLNVVMACATEHARDVSIPATAETGLSLEGLGRLRNFIDTQRISEINRLGV